MRKVYLVVALSLLLVSCGGPGPDTTPQNPSSPAEEPAQVPPKVVEEEGQDDFFQYQWNLHSGFSGLSGVKVNAGSDVKTAWEKTSGKGVKVAVIDFGFDSTHEDFRNNVLLTYNAHTQTSNVEGMTGASSQWHGTAVASIIASRANNSLGIRGVAPEASLILIKLENEGENRGISGSQMGRAFDFAVNNGAKVINCSWGSYYPAREVDRIMFQDIKSRGITVVFSAGNGNKNHSDYEQLVSDLDSVIGVGASNEKNGRAFYSDFGPYIDVLAPAGDEWGIPSADVTGPDGYNKGDGTAQNDVELDLPDNYHMFSGTSAAAPMVSGMIVLLKAAHPELNEDQIHQKLRDSTDKIVGDTHKATSSESNAPVPNESIENCSYDSSGFSTKCAYGKLNAKKLLN